MLDAHVRRHPDRAAIKALADHLASPLESPATRKNIEEEAALGRRITLAAWCDRNLGTQITEQINRESIKWCEAFLDEGHATWPMPYRERGFTLPGNFSPNANGPPAELQIVDGNWLACRHNRRTLCSKV